MWIWRWYSAAARTVTYTNIKGRDPTPNFLHSEQQQIRPIASDRSPPQSRPALLPEFEAGLVAFNDPQRPSVIWSIIQLRGRALKGVVCLIKKRHQNNGVIRWLRWCMNDDQFGHRSDEKWSVTCGYEIFMYLRRDVYMMSVRGDVSVSSRATKTSNPGFIGLLRWYRYQDEVIQTKSLLWRLVWADISLGYTRIVIGRRRQSGWWPIPSLLFLYFRSHLYMKVKF